MPAVKTYDSSAQATAKPALAGCWGDVLLAILRSPLSLPVSALWWLHAGARIKTGRRLMAAVHECPAMLPEAWRFYEAFKELPSYRESITGFGAHDGEPAWAAEAIVGEGPAYRIQLSLPVELPRHAQSIQPGGDPLYFVVEGEVKDGSFQVDPHGLQARLDGHSWQEQVLEFADPARVDRAAAAVRSSGAVANHFG